MTNDTFKFTMPAELEKSKDGEWRIRGLASTESVDKQGETIIAKGIDLTPVDEGKGWLNFDHGKGPEYLIGTLDGYTKTDKGLYIEGRLFKKHTKAKAVKEIMDSLGKSDRGRCGLSVEGKILERCSKNPKIIKKCRINAVAVTMNPVNSNTYVDLIKSLNSTESIEFASTKSESTENSSEDNSEANFTATQVLSIVQKALSISGDSGSKPSGEKSGGEALTQENFGKKKKKLKKLESPLGKSIMLSMLDKLQTLYPESSRSELWESVKDRLDTKFPQLSIKEMNS